MLLGKDTINEIFGIVQSLNDADRKLIKEESKKSYFRGERMLRWLPVGSFVAAGILAILSKWLDIKPLSQVSYLILLLSYLSIILSQIIILPIKFWTQRKLMVNPSGYIIDVARKYSEADVQHVNDFYKYETYALKYALVQLKAERAAFERRVAMLVGALEKVGIIPGLAALIAIYIRPEVTKSLTEWITVIAWATPFIYGMGMQSHLHMSILDRHIMLTEMAIEAKESARPAQSLSNGLTFPHRDFSKYGC